MNGWGLPAISVACGAGAWLVTRRTVDGAAWRGAVKRIQARLLEFLLFGEEPSLVWQAQKAAAAESCRLLALMMKPALILALPMAWIFLQLSQMYGWAPLAVGRSAVVTLRTTRGGALESATYALESPGINVETPPVRIPAEGRICWRVRAISAMRAPLRLIVGGAALSVERRRVRPLWEFLLSPEEPRLPPGDIVSLEVEHPRDWSWLVWFLAISTATTAACALCLRRL